MGTHVPFAAKAGVLLAVLAVVTVTIVTFSQDFNFHGKGSGEWRMAGQNIDGTRNQPAEHLINPST